MALSAKVKLVSATRQPRRGGGEVLCGSDIGHRREIDAEAERDPDGDPDSGRGSRNATYEVRQKEALDWPLATASVATGDERHVRLERQIVLGHVAATPWDVSSAAESLIGKPVNVGEDAAGGRPGRRGRRETAERQRYKVQLAKVAVKRALLAASGQPGTMRGGTKG